MEKMGFIPFSFLKIVFQYLIQKCSALTLHILLLQSTVIYQTCSEPVLIGFVCLQTASLSTRQS